MSLPSLLLFVGGQTPYLTYLQRGTLFMLYSSFLGYRNQALSASPSQIIRNRETNSWRVFFFA